MQRSLSPCRRKPVKPFSVVFWSLVLVTALVSYRWGSMAGLIVFIVLLMTSALVASHLAM